MSRTKELIIEVIKKLRYQGLSYTQIGEKLGIARGVVRNIEKGIWYPSVDNKNEAVRQNALKIEVNILLKLMGGIK